MSWSDTRFARILELKYPIIQGPFGGGLSRVSLASAVSNAGGLGSFGAHHLEGKEITDLAASLRESTAQPFALNLWVPLEGQKTELSRETYDRASALLEPWFERFGIERPAYEAYEAPSYELQVEALLEAEPRVFSFVFGVPDRKILAEARRRGIFTIGAATHLDEGIVLEEAGVDAVVASGYEAGGHRPSFLGHARDSVATGPLTAMLSSRLRIPVIAAGGIVDGRGVVSAIALGAEAVQLGTAFLATDESGATYAHREMLRADRGHYTALTRAFSGRWARGIRNEALEGLNDYEPEIADYPEQQWMYSDIKKASAQQNDAEGLSLWAGQGAPLLSDERHAAGVVASLVHDTGRVLSDLPR